jgi:hypothetical protein
MKPVYIYIASLPERATRATAALLGGLINETTNVLLPLPIRRSRLYQATVARLLRITIELVGGVKGVYPAEALPIESLLKRKAAGNVVELASFLAVGWSPLWLLAGASDLLGGTKTYLQALTIELKRSGALPHTLDISSFDELLASLEGTSGVLADTIDVPPLDVPSIRELWHELQRHASDLPSAERLAVIFAELQRAAQREGRSLLQISSVVALGAARAGLQLGNTYLFDYYREALRTIAQEGLISYLRRVSRPYLHSAATHFSPRSPTLTQRIARHLTSRRQAKQSEEVERGKQFR